MISWCSKKQTCVALSMMEAEYVTCTAAVQEAVWLKAFIHNLNVTPHNNESVVIYSDNTAALAYVKNLKYHGKSKHIEKKYHFIRDVVAKGGIILKHIFTGDMVVDPFTKPLQNDVFTKHIRSMDLCRM